MTGGGFHLSRLIQMMFDGPTDILCFLEGKFLTGKSTGTPWNPPIFHGNKLGKNHGFQYKLWKNHGFPVSRCSQKQCVEVSVVNQ